MCPLVDKEISSPFRSYERVYATTKMQRKLVLLIVKLNLLNDSILHVDISQERLIIVHYLRSFDEETVTLKRADSISPLTIKYQKFEPPAERSKRARNRLY